MKLLLAWCRLRAVFLAMLVIQHTSDVYGQSLGLPRYLTSAEVAATASSQYEPQVAQLNAGPSPQEYWLNPNQQSPDRPSYYPGRSRGKTPLLIPPPPAPKGKPLSSDRHQGHDSAESTLAHFEQLAVRALEKEDWTRAELLLRGMLELKPGHRNARIALARLLMSRERPREAAQLLVSSCAGGLPRDGELQLLYATALMQAEETPAAICVLSRIHHCEPCLDDLHLLLGTAYLQEEQPFLGLSILRSGSNSGIESTQQQKLAVGSALAQLGQVQAADSIFCDLANCAASQALADNAWQNHCDLQEAIFGPSRLYGSLKASVRYDDNTGVLPTTNLFGVATSNVESWGSLGFTNLNYDIFRSLQTTVTTGYNGLSVNYFDAAASPFDLLDHSAYLSANHRSLTPMRQLPCVASVRVDYNNTSASSDPFLERLGLGGTLAVRDSDFTLTTAQLRVTALNFLNQTAGIEGSAVDPDSVSYEAGLFRQWQNYERYLSWQLGYLYNRNESHGTDFDYHGHRVLGGCSYEFENESVMSANLQYFFRDYDNLQSATANFREDSELLAGLTYVRPVSDAFYLIAEIAYDLNDSNVAASNYDRSVVDLGLQWNFGQGQAACRK